ncbi:MAG: gliding motility-associated C-terminal domain-containing protein [Bacteroidota bacterium]|nr:gliding motility-associated C-terminal domain-containing protein [Bacteroidota bacterium]
MSKDIQHIDQMMNEAFQNWEAPTSTQQINADWSVVQQGISPIAPQVPAPSSTHWNVLSNIGLVKLCVGVIASIVAIVAIAVYVNRNDSKAPETTVIQNEIKVSPETETSNTNPIIVIDSIESKIDTLSPTKTITYDSYPKIIEKGSIRIRTNYNAFLNWPLVNRMFSNYHKYGHLDSYNNGNNQTKSNNAISEHETVVLLVSDSIIPACNDVSIIVQNVDYNSMEISWGDGNYNKINQKIQHKYCQPGQYTLSVLFDGKVLSRKNLTVVVAPIASFDYEIAEDNIVYFKNTSQYTQLYYWSFGDENISNGTVSPIHKYYDTGKYYVKLVAKSGILSDTFGIHIYVHKMQAPKVYNVFTPNNDGKNDNWEIDIEGEDYFNLMIYNQLGELVFRSEKNSLKWNGTHIGTGNPCEAGVYQYIIKYKFPHQPTVKQLNGRVMLNR